MKHSTYRWDTVCFSTDQEDPDELHGRLNAWLEKNFPASGRGVPLHAMCMAAHGCGFEWHVTDYLWGDTAILLFQSKGSGSDLHEAAIEYKKDILRIVCEQTC